MKKLMIGIIILSIGLMAYGGYTNRRWSAPRATTDVNYAELAALIDANDLTDPNSHNAVTVTDSNSIDFTLTGQNITGDVNEVWLSLQNATDPNGQAAFILVSNLITLSGVDANSTNLGTFDGSTIGDANTIKEAIQLLETAIEGLAGGHDAVTFDANMATLFYLDSQVIEVNLATPADGVTKLSTADQIYDWVMGLIGTTVQAYDANLPDFPTDPDADKFLKWDDTNSVLVWADANSSATGTGDMLLATYDTLENGFVDGNDTKYGDDWDSNPDAPSMNAVYDKFESVVSGTVGYASSDSIIFTIIDGNLVPDINDAWLDVNAPAGGTGDANAIMATHLATFDHNDISAYRYYSFSLPDPNSIYDSNAVFPIDCNVASALSLLQVRVVCDKNPATELDLDLKYATDETLAGATVISALDTTAGKSTTYLTSSVAATKFFYIQFGARPDETIDWMRVDIKCTTNDFDFKQAVIVEPNECYDVNAIFPVDYCFNAATISQIQFKCDINPTNEPNITLYYGDAQTGSGTKICDIDTTDGKATINSFDDATITAGSDIWGIWNEAPDALIKWEIIKIARTDD